MLQRGEQRIELGEMGVVVGLESVDGVQVLSR